MGNDTEFVLLKQCEHIIEAQHLVNVLCAAGLNAQLRNAWLAGVQGMVPLAETYPEVWVLETQQGRALHCLQQSARADTEEQWRCTGCGELLDGGFSQCWRCGALREKGNY